MGTVSFVSALLHPGSVFDNAITRNFGILDLLDRGGGGKGVRGSHITNESSNYPRDCSIPNGTIPVH